MTSLQSLPQSLHGHLPVCHLIFLHAISVSKSPSSHKDQSLDWAPPYSSKTSSQTNYIRKNFSPIRSHSQVPGGHEFWGDMFQPSADVTTKRQPPEDWHESRVGLLDYRATGGDNARRPRHTYCAPALGSRTWLSHTAWGGRNPQPERELHFVKVTHSGSAHLASA